MPLVLTRAAPPEDSYESFEALCKTLFGDALDAREVWEDVHKGSPDQADLHVNGQVSGRRQRAVTAGLNAVGAAAGTAGLGVGLRSARAARLAGRKVGLGTKGFMALEGVGLGGEVMATRILHRDVKNAPQGTFRPTGRKQPVAKAASMKALVEGTMSSFRRLVGTGARAGEGAPAAGKIAKPKAAPKPKAEGKAPVEGTEPTKPPTGTEGQAQRNQARAAGTAAGRAVNRMTATSGAKLKTAAGGAVLGGGGVAAIHHRRNQVAGGTYGVPSGGLTFGKIDSFTAEGDFAKFDDDQRLAFGWASVVEVNGQPVVDRQGDYITPEDLEKAAYNYVLRSRVGGDMHKRAGEAPHHVSDLVESFVITPEKIEKMGLPDNTPVGWWVGFKFHDDDTWATVKKGDKAGFSIHGRGKREDLDLDDLMGYR